MHRVSKNASSSLLGNYSQVNQTDQMVTILLAFLQRLIDTVSDTV